MKRVAWLSVAVMLALLIWLLWPDSPDLSGPAQPGAMTQSQSKKEDREDQRQQVWQEIVHDDDPVGSLRLEGQVLDENDLPVEGAWVSISTNPGRTATAEKDGTFAFDGLVEKSYRLTARKDMQVGGPVTHRLTSTSQPVIIRLTTGSAVEISVFEARKQRPVRGAQVELSGFRSTGRQSGLTGADGIVRFDGVMPGFCAVTVQADGFAPVQRNLAVPQGAKSAIRIRIEMSRGLRVAGRVLTDTGDPVAGARVAATESGAFFPRADQDFSHARSDEQGRFVIPALVPGNYRLTAYHSDHPPASTRPLAIDRPKDDIEIIMTAGASIQGRVVGQDNAPAPWAEVRLQESGSGFRFRQQRGTTADRDGTFKFGGLPRKQVELMAIGENASSPVKQFNLAERPVVSGVELRLSQQGRIAGRVIDSQGRPAPEIYVNATADFMAGDAPADLGLRRRLQTISDGGGRFAFEGLSPGSYRLMASRIQVRSRGRFFGLRGVKAHTGDEDVTLTIEDPGGIRGRVVLAGGQPPDRFGVGVDWNPPVPFENPQGEFEISPVEPGDHHVVVSGDDFADHHLPDVKVQGGKISDLGEIVIQPGRTVTGRVVDKDGQPVQGASVMVDRFLAGDGTSLGSAFRRGGLDRARSTTTANDGTFRLESISTEPRVIAAEHSQRGRSDVVRIETGKQEVFVELVLRGFGSVEGLVTSAMKPVADAHITARPASGGTMIMVSAGADGRYLIEKLPEGEHRIEANRSGGFRGRDSLRKNLMVQAGETVQLDFQFDEGPAALVVDVRGLDGATIDMAFVSLFQGTVAFTRVSELFAAGTSFEGTISSMLWRSGRPVRFSRLVPGDYTVCITPLQVDEGSFPRMHLLRQHADRLRVYCFPCPVADTTSEQQFSAEVPPMEPLPEDLPEDQAESPDAGQIQNAPGPKRINP